VKPIASRAVVAWLLGLPALFVLIIVAGVLLVSGPARSAGSPAPA
jgi:hypothetical protein